MNFDKAKHTVCHGINPPHRYPFTYKTKTQHGFDNSVSCSDSCLRYPWIDIRRRRLQILGACRAGEETSGEFNIEGWYLGTREGDVLLDSLQPIHGLIIP